MKRIIEWFKKHWWEVIFVTPIIVATVIAVINGMSENANNTIRWNNGVCTQCGGRYEIYTITNNGRHYYICDNCGHEVRFYRAMR